MTATAMAMRVTGRVVCSITSPGGQPQSGMALPNGSRLSCGRPARRRKAVGRQSVPARAQHSVSFRAITVRQLQALVRQRPGTFAPDR